jgi:hypothetical protein
MEKPEIKRTRAKFDPDHPVFVAPETDASIWRYMDFTKLVAMLDAKALYLARVDTFRDPFEGSIPDATAQDRAELIASMDISEDRKREMLAGWSRHAELSVTLTYVNCWNLSEGESAALWELYVPPTGGVAIRSTYQRLTDSVLMPTEIEEKVAEDAESAVPPLYVGKVNYLDYSSGRFDLGNGFYPFVHKRRSFEHERELRAMIWLPEIEPDEESPLGLELEVDLPMLIESIYVSPAAPRWFARLVKSVVAKYGCNVPVRQSALNAEPLF